MKYRRIAIKAMVDLELKEHLFPVKRWTRSTINSLLSRKKWKEWQLEL